MSLFSYCGILSSSEFFGRNLLSLLSCRSSDQICGQTIFTMTARDRRGPPKSSRGFFIGLRAARFARDFVAGSALAPLLFPAEAAR